MKRLYILILLLCFSSVSFASIWRSKAPVEISGLIYDVYLSYSSRGEGQDATIIIILKFYLLGTGYNGFSEYQKVGNYSHIRKAYMGVPGNNPNKRSQYATVLTNQLAD